MRFRNVHERRLPIGSDPGRLIDALSGSDDPLWPWETWPPMRFDRSLGPGADGGHGPVRYEVSEYEPGRRIRFAPIKAPRGLHGYHEFEVVEQEDAAVLRHVIDGELRGLGYLNWVLVFRPLHDALIEDALDKAELGVTGRIRNRSRWSLWVGALRSSFIWLAWLRKQPFVARLASPSAFVVGSDEIRLSPEDLGT